MVLATFALYAAYTGVLVSFLAVNTFSPPFTTLEGLLKSDYKVFILNGISTIDVFKVINNFPNVKKYSIFSMLT